MMSIYVNPKDGDKLKWLVKNMKGRPSFVPFPKHTDGTNVQLVWVDNGPFDALAIAYSSRELQVFYNPQDPRPKYFAMVPITALTKEVTGVEDIRKSIVLS